MKNTISRIIIFLLVAAAGITFYWLLTLLGDKSKGPLDDLASSVNDNVASLEKKMIGNARENRSATLDWFNKYRNNKILLNTTDTIFTGAYDDNTLESFESIVALEDSLHIKLPIIQIYTAWGSHKQQVFPFLRTQAIYDLGSIPLITWEPWLDDFDAEKYPVLAKLKNKNTGGMKAIAEGKFDDYIDKWATDAKKFGVPFYLRFGHEMNDPYRYPWGPQNNKPEDFIAAWQHVVNRFRSIGANNAIWVWSPHPAYTTYAQFYPGHDYVDWIGVTTLNYGTVAPWSQWYSFKEIFQNCYNDLSLYKKPMVLTEIGSLDVGGKKADWFKKALDSIPSAYPAVKALLFFHVSSDNTTTYKALDWSFASDSLVTTAIRQSIGNWKIKRRF